MNNQRHRGNREIIKPDSLLFDLDGTLWDAASSCTRAWRKSLEQMGYQGDGIDENLIRSISGLKIDRVLQQCFPFLEEEKQAELLVLYKRNEPVFMKKFGGTLYPQVRDTLQMLHEAYRLYVVSNCLAGYIENFLSFHHLGDLFCDFESSGHTGLAKSDNLKLLVERNQLVNPVYIGDTVWDQEAAREAGVPFIYASYGFGRAPGATRSLNAFADLPRLLLMDTARAGGKV